MVNFTTGASLNHSNLFELVYVSKFLITPMIYDLTEIEIRI